MPLIVIYVIILPYWGGDSMYSIPEKLKTSVERVDLKNIDSFSVDNTQKLLGINFKGEPNDFAVVYYDDKYELLRDLQGLQSYLEHELKEKNQRLDASIKGVYHEQIENTDAYARRNVGIGLLTFLGNLSAIPFITGFQFLPFIGLILAVDAVGAVSLVINKKVQKKNEDKLFTKKANLERDKKLNVANFKRLANSLKHVALKVKYNEKEEPTDSFDFTLSIENYFNDEKEKIMRFTL